MTKQLPEEPDNEFGPGEEYRVVWRIEVPEGSAARCIDFPIGYGQVPAGMNQVVAARPLKPNIIYETLGSMPGATGGGMFRLSIKTMKIIST